MRRADLVCGAILTPVWIALVFYVIPAYVGPGDEGSLQPAFMPTLAAACGLVFMIAMLAHRLMRPSAVEGPNPMPWPSWIFLIAAMATFAGGLFVISNVGYLYGGPIVVAGFMALARAKLWHAVATVIVAPVAIWAVFWHLLTIPLP